MVVIGSPNIEFDEYVGATDDSIKALVNKVTISVEYSLLNSETNIGRAVANSSTLFIDDNLETFKNLPLRSMPLSARWAIFTNTVSGTKPHIPLLDIFISPAKCISAMSFGKVLIIRCSASIDCAALVITLSIPFPTLSILFNISKISDVGNPSLANLFLYSS